MKHLTYFLAVLVLAASTVSAGAAGSSHSQKWCNGAPGWVTCAQWCDKWRAGSDECKNTHPQSCKNKYGPRGLQACVKDGPPRD